MSESSRQRRPAPNQQRIIATGLRDRPKPNFRLDALHRGLFGISVVIAVTAPVIFWAKTWNMGGTLPMHYNMAGEVNREGSVTEAGITLIVVGLVTIGLVVLRRYPRIFNYPTMLTEDNVQKQYKTAVQMIAWTTLGSALIMVVMTGSWLGYMGITWIWLPLGIMFCAVGVSIVRMFRQG